jgi:hypothetical protein
MLHDCAELLLMVCWWWESQIASVSKSLCHHAKFRSVCCNANTG